jgi:hypothetical protein
MFGMKGDENRASPGVSPASPWARATPHPRATKWKKKKKIILYIK